MGFEKIKTFIYKFWFTLLHKLRGYIVISSWIYPIKFSFPNNNFGDDINRPLIKAISGKATVVKHSTLLKNSENLLCIGSIIENFTDENSIIWGSGALYGNKPLNIVPKKVYAVRGKHTRDYLLKQGINCPEVYGDPALLFPLIYKPVCTKQYQLGIVAHYSNFELPHVMEFRKEHPEVLFIKMRGYESWQKVIEEFCSCEYIASDSLHGLIVSDAYNIPNVWVQFKSSGLLGGEFKFCDYFSGVDRKYEAPIDWTNHIDISEFNTKIVNYQRIQFSPKRLLEAFPYKLKPEFCNLKDEKA